MVTVVQSATPYYNNESLSTMTCLLRKKIMIRSFHPPQVQIVYCEFQNIVVFATIHGWTHRFGNRAMAARWWIHLPLGWDGENGSMPTTFENNRMWDIDIYVCVLLFRAHGWLLDGSFFFLEKMLRLSRILQYRSNKQRINMQIFINMYISDGGQNVSHQCNFSKERTRYHQLEYHDDNNFRVHVPSIFQRFRRNQKYHLGRFLRLVTSSSSRRRKGGGDDDRRNRSLRLEMKGSPIPFCRVRNHVV